MTYTNDKYAWACSQFLLNTRFYNNDITTNRLDEKEPVYLLFGYNLQK